MDGAIVERALLGRSRIAGKTGADGGETFHSYSPTSGQRLEPVYSSASLNELDEAVRAAVEAFPFLSESSGKSRGALLRRIADGIDGASAELIERAQQETALPARPRLASEVARTSNQLRLFAHVVEEGSWVMARIDTADPKRTPPKPDVRSMLRPLGPVAVFGASNFPLAFSVAGGDTASALAAGNPVIVKAHPAHPGTGEIVGRIIDAAVSECGFPPGTFSSLFDAGFTIGSALVKHRDVRAVGFTGSFQAGRALMDLVATRPVPIPIYAEMGSTNPVFLLPGALQESPEKLADALHGSYTLGAGQFCTKPGLVFVSGTHQDNRDANRFRSRLRELATDCPGYSLLTASIAAQYRGRVRERTHLTTTHGSAAESEFGVQAALFETTHSTFVEDPALQEEIFGPSTLLIDCANTEELIAAARSLGGHLTATVLGTVEDLEKNAELLHVLENKAGRVIFNGFPTGVEVAHAMVHGGPYPATSDGRSTSVGSQAIFRFARPVAFQGLPQSLLAPELQDHNPACILRLWNGEWSREPAPKDRR